MSECHIANQTSNTFIINSYVLVHKSASDNGMQSDNTC